MNKQHVRNLFRSPDKKFYNFGVIDSGSVDLMIYGVVGYEFDTDELVSELKAVEASQINVYINSEGGFAYDGIAIYNALRNHDAKIVTCVEGLAASAASVIAMAGDEVQIGQGAMMMIHNPMSIMVGESKDMRKEADSLDKLQESLAQIYSKKSGRPATDFIPMMNEETWFTADEAKAAGLADTITNDTTEPAATEDSLAVYNHVPDRLRAAALSKGKLKMITTDIAPIPAGAAPAPGDPKERAKSEWAAMSAADRDAWFDEKTFVCARGLELQGRLLTKSSGTSTIAAAVEDEVDEESVVAAAAAEWEQMPRAERDRWFDKKAFITVKKVGARQAARLR